MPFSERFKDLAKQAQDAVAEHKDEIADAVDRASVLANERTQGKYSDKIARIGEKAGQAIEKLSGRDDDAGRDKPTDSGDETAGGRPPAA